MALPPILTNLSVLKFFGTGASQSGKAEKALTEPAGAKLPQDVVKLSSAAQKKLEGEQEMSETQARRLASDTGAILLESSVSLGLDPKFSD